MHPSSRIGPIISILGAVLSVIGFSLPVYSISLPNNSDASLHSPIIVDGWLIVIQRAPYYYYTSYITGVFNLLIIVTAIMLITSFLIFFRKNSLLIHRTRLFTSFASMALLIFFFLTLLFLNWEPSPDAAAASPIFDAGPGFWVLLLGMALSAAGVGGASIGAFLGACLGTFIGGFLWLISSSAWANFIYHAAPAVAFFLGLIQWVLYPGFSILGGILGGWVILKMQARFRRSHSAPRS